jgi:hypothetical protein
MRGWTPRIGSVQVVGRVFSPEYQEGRLKGI